MEGRKEEEPEEIEQLNFRMLWKNRKLKKLNIKGIGEQDEVCILQGELFRGLKCQRIDELELDVRLLNFDAALILNNHLIEPSHNHLQKLSFVSQYDCYEEINKPQKDFKIFTALFDKINMPNLNQFSCERQITQFQINKIITISANFDNITWLSLKFDEDDQLNLKPDVQMKNVKFLSLQLNTNRVSFHRMIRDSIIAPSQKNIVYFKIHLNQISSPVKNISNMIKDLELTNLNSFSITGGLSMKNEDQMQLNQSIMYPSRRILKSLEIVQCHVMNGEINQFLANIDHLKLTSLKIENLANMNQQDFEIINKKIIKPSLMTLKVFKFSNTMDGFENTHIMSLFNEVLLDKLEDLVLLIPILELEPECIDLILNNIIKPSSCLLENIEINLHPKHSYQILKQFQIQDIQFKSLKNYETDLFDCAILETKIFRESIFIPSQTTLDTICLSNCGLNSESLDQLIGGIRFNSLKELYLDYNPNLGVEGINILNRKVLKQIDISTLGLEFCGIELKTINQLKKQNIPNLYTHSSKTKEIYLDQRQKMHLRDLIMQMEAESIYSDQLNTLEQQADDIESDYGDEIQIHQDEKQIPFEVQYNEGSGQIFKELNVEDYKEERL